MKLDKSIFPRWQDLVTIFRYDPETGFLYWARTRPYRHFKNKHAFNAWHGRFAGKRIDYNIGEYLAVRLDGRLWLVHDIVYAMCHRINPPDMPDMIDHKDENKENNLLDNLRPANKSENMCNTSIRADNTSGYKGVAWNERSQKWMAYYDKDGKRTYLGTFDDKEIANTVRRAAVEKAHGEFTNHGN